MQIFSDDAAHINVHKEFQVHECAHTHVQTILLHIQLNNKSP
jgi:hypothetical protein